MAVYRLLCGGRDWLSDAVSLVAKGGQVPVGACASPQRHYFRSLAAVLALRCGRRLLMSNYDWNLSAGAPLCVFSDSFYYSARDAVFRQLSKDSTKEQFQAALETLTQLRDELVQTLYPMHYGALVGRHRCVDHVFREARARLRSLEIMQPVPKPPPPPKQQLITREGVVMDLEEKIQTSIEQTDLGTDH